MGLVCICVCGQRHEPLGAAGAMFYDDGSLTPWGSYCADLDPALAKTLGYIKDPDGKWHNPELWLSAVEADELGMLVARAKLTEEE